MPLGENRRANPAVIAAIGLIAVTAVVVAVAVVVNTGSEPKLIVVQARPNDDPDVPFVFDPPIVEVNAGTTIRWVNQSRTFHTVTFGPETGERVSNGTFDQSMFEVGDTIERTFNEAGQFHYFCQPHVAFMAGTVVVTD